VPPHASHTASTRTCAPHPGAHSNLTGLQQQPVRWLQKARQDRALQKFVGELDKLRDDWVCVVCGTWGAGWWALKLQLPALVEVKFVPWRVGLWALLCGPVWCAVWCFWLGRYT